MTRFWSDPARTILALALAAAAILGTALLSQYVGGLQPCVLCYYQRIPYAAVIGLGAYALVLRGSLGRGGLVATVILLCLLLLADAGIAFYHVGVEQHWWLGTAACATRPLAGLSVADMRRALLETAVVRCDEPAWVLFGISMAGYNVLAASVLAVFGLGAGWRQHRAR
ncbi:MAG: disulfide bond formation protein B [Alphaproteobacteria bacterium]|nr:disulfide bond formation protein B [Alphaproteobacteria bacterium]